MKIIPIHNYDIKTNNLTSFKNKKAEEKKIGSGSNYPIVLSSVVLAGIGVVALYKLKNNKKSVEERITKQNSEYLENLSKSIEKHIGKKVESLSCVISGEELLKELPNLKRENFVASVENVKNGVFLADLHSHSKFSDGKGDVKKILENVANYADKLNQLNGKKFIYALTDHDSCEGVKEALCLISQNPQKYQNVKFVTGSELSYLIKSNKTSNPYETSEILVYGFNPFDEKIDNFFKKLQSRRKRLAQDFIAELNQRFGYANFSFEEFAKTYLSENGCLMMNNQWKVHHYGQTKNAIAGLAGFQNRNREELYKEIISKSGKNNPSLNDLRTMKLVPESFGDDSNITRICKEKYTPHNSKNTINFAGENNFDDIVSLFDGDKDVFGAFAHPYYVTERTSEYQSTFSDLVERSKGFIKATESFHQAYGKNIEFGEVEKVNDYIVSKYKLLELGGRDNHKRTWLEFAKTD